MTDTLPIKSQIKSDIAKRLLRLSTDTSDNRSLRAHYRKASFQIENESSIWENIYAYEFPDFLRTRSEKQNEQYANILLFVNRIYSHHFRHNSNTFSLEDNVSIGKTLYKLTHQVGKESKSRETSAHRIFAAKSYHSMLNRLDGVLLTGKGQKIDYPVLASNLWDASHGYMKDTLLRWGKDYYFNQQNGTD